MNYYQEITLLPDAEIPLGFIWQNVFQQVHIALVENKVGDNQSKIAVGFPQYQQVKYPLGNKLRLFAEEQVDLERLDITRWLNRLEDYTHVKGIKLVPDGVEYVCFSRKNVKSLNQIEKNIPKKAQLLAEKSGRALEDCQQELEAKKPDLHCKLPFVFLHSQQTKQRSPDANSKFPLFIQMDKAVNKQGGAFDCYGLSTRSNLKSQRGTVPHF